MGLNQGRSGGSKAAYSLVSKVTMDIFIHGHKQSECLGFVYSLVNLEGKFDKNEGVDSNDRGQNR